MTGLCICHPYSDRTVINASTSITLAALRGQRRPSKGISSDCCWQVRRPRDPKDEGAAIVRVKVMPLLSYIGVRHFPSAAFLPIGADSHSKLMSLVSHCLGIHALFRWDKVHGMFGVPERAGVTGVSSSTAQASRSKLEPYLRPHELNLVRD